MGEGVQVGSPGSGVAGRGLEVRLVSAVDEARKMDLSGAQAVARKDKTSETSRIPRAVLCVLEYESFSEGVLMIYRINPALICRADIAAG